MGTRVRSLVQQEPEPEDAVAMMIDGHLWCWMDGPRLFVRLREGDVPADFQTPAEQHHLDFIRTISAEKVPGPALPVERGDTTTIGGVPVDDDKLDAIEKLHGALAWRVWRQWFVARNDAGEVVAVWKTPATHGFLTVNPTEYDGDLWAFSNHFFFRMNTALLPPEALAKMREHLSQDPGLGAKIEKASRGAKLTVVRRSGKNGEIVRVGGVLVPREQYLSVLANNGKDLEWLWTGPTAPVLARRDGKPVAVIMPIVVENTATRGTA